MPLWLSGRQGPLWSSVHASLSVHRVVIVFRQRFVGIGKPQGRLLAQLRRSRMDSGNHRQGEIAAVERLRNRTKA
jgi:hypothetical protein